MDRRVLAMEILDLCDTRKEQVALTFSAYGKDGFYEAPASSIHHRNYEGGLFDHSLGVTKTLVKLRNSMFEEVGGQVGWPTVESCVIVGMFHDLHKCCDGFGRNYYVPNILQSGKASSAKPYARNPECMAMLGGYASVFLASLYIPLYEHEIQAIACHDGQYVPSNKEVALKEHPLTVMLHFADYWNAIIIEDKDSWMYKETSRLQYA